MTVKSMFGTLLLISACLPAAGLGQTAASPLAPSGNPRPKLDCTKDPATQLDFWIGDWKVTRHSDGAMFGINHFRKQIDGCAILEDFKAKFPDGSDYLGTSLSYYDPSVQQWHQFYVDNRGRRSVYAGNMQGGDWVMIAPMVRPGYVPFLMRMIVRRNPDGSVKQLGAISIDDGKTWKPTFDLDYTRL
jgi:hypothetical protein